MIEPVISSILTPFLSPTLWFFNKKNSTVRALTSLSVNIIRNLNERNIDWSTFVDLQKVFDTVEHGILLSKPEHYGIGGLVIEWFKSFLSDRKKCFNQWLQFLSCYSEIWCPARLTSWSVFVSHLY